MAPLKTRAWEGGIHWTVFLEYEYRWTSGSQEVSLLGHFAFIKIKNRLDLSVTNVYGATSSYDTSVYGATPSRRGIVRTPVDLQL